MSFRRRAILRWLPDERILKLALLVLLALVFLFGPRLSNGSDDPNTLVKVEDLIREKVYGQHELFEPQMPIDKVLVLTYSNAGLEIAKAVLWDHADLWFMSANPFDAVLSMAAKTSQSALQSTVGEAAKFVANSLSCNVNASQLHLIRDHSMPHLCKSHSHVSPDDRVSCLNSLCKQRGIKIMALRDLKLTQLEQLVHLFKPTLKIVLIQEIPDQDARADKHAQRMCERMMFDTERAAEIEGNRPGIHSVYFVEDFARNWLSQSLALMHFIGLSPDSKHTKKAIGENPIRKSMDLLPKASPWISIIEKCHHH